MAPGGVTSSPWDSKRRFASKTRTMRRLDSLILVDTDVSSDGSINVNIMATSKVLLQDLNVMESRT